MPASTTRDVAVAVKVEPEVGIGKTTIGGSAITVVAYIGAVLALRQGDRSPETIALAALGTIALVTVMVGRFAQAVAAIKAVGAAAPIALDAQPIEGYLAGAEVRNVARLEERVVEAVARGFREEGAGTALRDRAARELVKQQRAEPDVDGEGPIEEEALEDAEPRDPRA